MHICLVYDCLYPHTVGGAERWYRSLGERLAAEGHEVTYLTLRQWDRGTDPGVPGVRVRAVGPRMSLYGPDGNRRIWPPLVFGAGVLWRLLRDGRRYDVVHTAAFPYFSVLAACAARPAGRFGLIVDWHEVWTRAYWHEYLGRIAGTLGWLVQRACAALPQRAFCFSHLHARRLREEGLRGEVTVLEGEYAGPLEPADPVPARPIVVFAGRQIPDKRVPALVRAVARARDTLPDLRCDIYGDGPERPAIERLIEAEGLTGAIRVHGFVSGAEIEEALRSALCMVLPSRREGYGLVVVEAAAQGTPSVVVAGADNAATELVSEGHNGYIAQSHEPDALASAILRVHDAGPALRSRTVDWFRANAQRLSLERSLETVTGSYSRAPS